VRVRSASRVFFLPVDLAVLLRGPRTGVNFHHFPATIEPHVWGSVARNWSFAKAANQKFVRAVLRIVRSALALLPPSRAGLTRREVEGVYLLVRHIAQTGTQAGEIELARHIKEWANESRRKLLGLPTLPQAGVPSLFRFLRGRYKTCVDGGPNWMNIFASMSRALPFPNRSEHQKLFTKALAFHKECLSSPWITGEEETAEQAQHQIEFERYCFQFSKKFMAGTQFREQTVRLSNSACLERSRKRGGAEAQLKEELPPPNTSVRDLYKPRYLGAYDTFIKDPMEMQEFLALKLAKVNELPPALKHTHDSCVLYQKDLVHYARSRCAELYDNAEIPRAKVECVSDKGFKARIVTKSPAFLQASAEPIGQAMLKGLERFPPTKGKLLGLELLDVVEKIALPPPGGVYVSADLTAASDLIPHEIALAGWKGICRGLGWEQTNAVYKTGAIALGPQEVTWDDGTQSRTKRGILMGLPLTWPILSLLNCYCAEFNNPGTKGRYTTCGDDLAGAWSHSQAERYRQNLSELGLRVSKGKHFESPHGFVFTEETALITWTPGKRAVGRPTLGDFFPLPPEPDKTPTLKVVPAVKLSQLLLTRSGQQPTARDPATAGSIGETLGEILRHVKANQRRTTTKVFYQANRERIRQLTSAKLPLLLPKQFGGIGLLPTRKLRYGAIATPFRRAVAVILGDESREGMYRSRQLTHFWRNSTSSQVHEEAKKSMEHILQNVPTHTNGGGPSLDEFADNLYSSLSSQLSVVLPAEAKKGADIKFRPFQISRTLRRAADKIAAIWQSAKPMGSQKIINYGPQKLAALQQRHRICETTQRGYLLALRPAVELLDTPSQDKFMEELGKRLHQRVKLLPMQQRPRHQAI